MASPIRLDASTVGVVIHCRECGHWSAFRFTKLEAWAVAIAHEERVHPEHREQRAAAEQRAYEARHAV